MEAELMFPVDDIEKLDFAKGNGLLPAIIQHAHTGAILMLGFMNRDAFEATLARRRVVFYSRTKARLWEKGETSGHYLEVSAIRPDCDHDALLITALPHGPTCHLGTTSCFGTPPALHPLAFLAELESIIADRTAKRPEGSYTARLTASGIKRIAQKLGEEALELSLGAAAGDDHEVIAEAADLFYHLIVLLNARGLRLRQVVEELRARHEARDS